MQCACALCAQVKVFLIIPLLYESSLFLMVWEFEFHSNTSCCSWKKRGFWSAFVNLNHCYCLALLLLGAVTAWWSDFDSELLQASIFGETNSVHDCIQGHFSINWLYHSHSLSWSTDGSFLVPARRPHLGWSTLYGKAKALDLVALGWHEISLCQSKRSRSGW